MDIDGYLADDLSALVASVRRANADYRSLLLDINRHAVKTQYAIVIPNDPQHSLAAGLFGRLVATVQSAVILLERGLTSQAGSVLRTSVEFWFAIEALSKTPDLVNRFLRDHDYSRKRTWRFRAKWATPEVMRMFDEIGEPTESGQELKTIQLAELADMEDVYRSLYSLLSLSTHVSAYDIDRHFVPGPTGRLAEIQMDPVVDGQDFYWDVSCAVLLGGLEALGKMFRKMERSKTDRLAIELQDVRLRCEPGHE